MILFNLCLLIAGLSMYDSGSESDQEDGKKKLRKSDKRKKSESPQPNLDPLAIAKAFADTVADPNLPPPSKEHQEWAEKVLDLPSRSRKDSSKKHSKSEEKRHQSDRRTSSQEEYDYHHSSKSSHKKSSKDKEKDSSKRRSSRSHSKTSDSPSQNRKSSSQRRSHSPPPPSGMSLAAGFPPPKSLAKPSKARSPLPRRGSLDRKRSHRSRSRSPSPASRRKVELRKRHGSRSPPYSSRRCALL